MRNTDAYFVPVRPIVNMNPNMNSSTFLGFFIVLELTVHLVRPLVNMNPPIKRVYF